MSDPTVPSRRLRILIVDDEDTLRSILTRILQREGHEVTNAEDGSLGLKMFREGEYDLVISDNSMPKMSGLEMVAEMKREKPGQAIMMYTANEALNAPGADLILQKPVTPEELLETIEKLQRGK